MFPLTVTNEARRLKFDTGVCPKVIEEFFGEDSERAEEVREYELSGAEEKELSKGGDAVTFLSDLRSGAGDFYETVLHNIMIYVCENGDIEDSKERCVPFSDAAKDYAGNCIVPQDSPCSATPISRTEEAVGTGTCERPSNCYWEQPVEKALFRDRRYTTEEADKNEDYLMGATADSYVAKTGKYLAVAVVLAVLNILIWTIFTIGRCCCCCLHASCFCRCCSWTPKEEGYSVGCQVRLPIFMYIAFLAAIVGSAGVAFVGDEDLGKAFNSLFDNSRTGLSDMQDFLGKANTPMQAIGDLVDAAADDSITILDGTDYVEYGMGNVITRINDFAVVYSDGINKAGASNDIQATLDSLDDVEEDVVENVRDILDTLKGSLVEGKEAMATALADASDQIVELNNTVDGFYADVDNLDEKVEDYKTVRQAGILATFAISLVCVLFGFLGVLSYWTPCKWDDILIYLMNLTWFFGSLIVTLSFILAGITIFLSVFWNDVCHFLDIIVQDFEPYVGAAASVGLNACFNNTPLVDAFNLTSKVDFQDKINTTLAVIENTDLDSQFADVSAPLDDINDLVKGILTATEFTDAVASLDGMINFANAPADCDVGQGPMSTSDCTSAKAACNYNVANQFTVANLGSFYEPWSLVAAAGITGNAQWVSKTSLLDDIDVARLGSETAEAYMLRVFKDTAGVCGGTDCGVAPVGASCNGGADCSMGVCGGADCAAVPGEACNSGADCDYPCATFEDTIQTIWSESAQAKQWHDDMLIDLGVEYFDDSGAEPVFCPSGTSTAAGTCPTQAYQDAGNARTVKQELYNFQNNITVTTNDIINIANSAVGDIMDQVTIFLCNMECGFVADLYNNVHDDLCSTLLGGVLQISAGFWFLAVFMFLNCSLGALLVVRMRGISKADYEGDDEGDGVEMKGVSLDLYN
ncbi:hypothetical protein TrVE_jg6612 [Triparma verrucosa]|uniref:Uncharacterized protein n=1 Tax=Triparma verrucosa TaxID=1606542 RepID=A0A9W7BN56_9STRA|nr:hypothetical protein TrVE_jg6612 [Triparma verrucosa]